MGRVADVGLAVVGGGAVDVLAKSTIMASLVLRSDYYF